jgi:glycosyltransferase involved in cell wall biosynthesis
MLSSNVLILTSWSIDDPLVEAYVLPYVKIVRKYLSSHYKIIIQTLEKSDKKSENSDSVRTKLLEYGVEWIPEKYVKFSAIALITTVFNLVKLLLYCRLNFVGVIHVWCTPAGVLGYILSILTGAKLVIDSYEPHAESMVENGTWKKFSFKFHILFYFEKLMSQQASVLISLTDKMKDYARTKYGVCNGKFYLKPACVNIEKFNESKIKNLELLRRYNLVDKFVMVYAGKLGGIYLDKEIFDFTSHAYRKFGENFRFLLLASNNRNEIDEYCRKSGVPTNIVILENIKHKDIPLFIGMADFAITPVKPVPSKRYCSPLKNGEYWALGLPVIISKDISDDSLIIENENIGAVIDNWNAEGYNLALNKLNIIFDLDKKILRRKIINVANTYRNFNLAESVYSEIYH